MAPSLFSDLVSIINELIALKASFFLRKLFEHSIRAERLKTLASQLNWTMQAFSVKAAQLTHLDVNVYCYFCSD